MGKKLTQEEKDGALSIKCPWYACLAEAGAMCRTTQSVNPKRYIVHRCRVAWWYLSLGDKV